jgi:hypothetical protein
MTNDRRNPSAGDAESKRMSPQKPPAGKRSATELYGTDLALTVKRKGRGQLAGPICDAVNLASVSVRLGGRRLLWHSAGAKITNIPEANRFLRREYRPGWEL